MEAGGGFPWFPFLRASRIDTIWAGRSLGDEAGLMHGWAGTEGPGYSDDERSSRGGAQDRGSPRHSVARSLCGRPVPCPGTFRIETRWAGRSFGDERGPMHGWAGTEARATLFMSVRQGAG